MTPEQAAVRVEVASSEDFQWPSIAPSEIRVLTSLPSDHKLQQSVPNLTELGSPGSRFRPFLIALDREARVFAAEVSDLLNHTITDGIRPWTA